MADLDPSQHSKRFDIDKKMIGILSVFTCLGVILVVTIIIATSTLSALRGYASLQTHWTEIRKEASLQLVSYFRTEEEQYYKGFSEAVNRIEDIRKIRTELFKENPDYNVVRSSLLNVPAIPDDIDDLIKTFERFHGFSDFQQAIRQWAVSDSLLNEMWMLASKIRPQIANGSFKATGRAEGVSRVFELDQKLTVAQHRLAEGLATGTALLKQIILWISSSLGIILLTTGGFLSFRFLKSLKKSRIALEVSEQQYRSLFEQNPNAVCSISRDGHIIQGNKALEKMIGHPLEDLKGAKIFHFLELSDFEKVKNHFHKTLEGEPQFFEAVGIRKNGDHIWAEITNLPIYVDGKITGVYGIARNITNRKRNEKKIKEQLEEKSHLLVEIHDRVKNNLTLILSLIQLQKDAIDDKKLKAFFNSTIARIYSMAKVHEQLYQTTNFSKIRIDKYLQEFLNSLDNSAGLVLDTTPLTLGIKQAIPMALLLNELVTNVFDCGDGDHPKRVVKVSLHRLNGQVELTVADELGLLQKSEIEKPKSLELRLIKALIQQLEGSFEFDQKNGSAFKINFTKEPQNLRTA